MAQEMWIWFGLAVLALIGELATGTFYLLLVAIGLGAGGVAALSATSFQAQLAICGAVVLAGLLVLRATGVLKKRGVDAARSSDANLDIGQVITVADWAGATTARAWYRGASWDVMLAPGSQAIAGDQVITEIRGSRLIVVPRRRP